MLVLIVVSSAGVLGNALLKCKAHASSTACRNSLCAGSRLRTVSYSACCTTHMPSGGLLENRVLSANLSLSCLALAILCKQ